MPGFERDSTVDIVKRHIADYAANQALSMFDELLREEPIRSGTVSRIAQAAAHAAIERFAGEIASQVALVNAYYEMRLEQANLHPRTPRVDLSELLRSKQ